MISNFAPTLVKPWPELADCKSIVPSKIRKTRENKDWFIMYFFFNVRQVHTCPITLFCQSIKSCYVTSQLNYFFARQNFRTGSENILKTRENRDWFIMYLFLFQGETSPCLPNPCSGGGTCEEHDNTFTCFCPDDRTGDRCERALSENDLRVRPLK